VGRFRIVAAILLVGSIVAAALVLVTAQPLTFEAATVRPNTSGDMRQRSSTQGRTYTVVNMPLLRVIGTAYEVGPILSRLTGGPSWMQNERFDITATLPEGTTFRDVPAMMRTLLADRFKLVVRRETREAPAYALTLARDDGRLGPRLRRSTIDCVAEQKAGRQHPHCQTRLLPSFAQRPVVDRTGLTGEFDVDIEIAPQSTAAGIDAGRGIFTAITEQLGLKLEPISAPLEFIVIESVERPTAN
jgi:bla regulator protein BlaR1